MYRFFMDPELGAMAFGAEVTRLNAMAHGAKVWGHNQCGRTCGGDGTLSLAPSWLTYGPVPFCFFLLCLSLPFIFLSRARKEVPSLAHRQHFTPPPCPPPPPSLPASPPVYPAASACLPCIGIVESKLHSLLEKSHIETMYWERCYEPCAQS